MFQQTDVVLVYFGATRKLAYVPIMDHPVIGRIYMYNGRMTTSLETLKDVINSPLMPVKDCY